MLNLLKLHPELQALARWTFDWAEDYVLGRHAFPDRRADLKLDFYACAFQTGADSLDSPPELKFAVENNADFLERVSKLVSCILILYSYTNYYVSRRRLVSAGSAATSKRLRAALCREHMGSEILPRRISRSV